MKPQTQIAGANHVTAAPLVVADHQPLYWFSRLVQAMATSNEIGKFQAQHELRRLGFDVQTVPPLVSP